MNEWKGKRENEKGELLVGWFVDHFDLLMISLGISGYPWMDGWIYGRLLVLCEVLTFLDNDMA